jgi:hypothetical protein
MTVKYSLIVTYSLITARGGGGGSAVRPFGRSAGGAARLAFCADGGCHSDRASGDRETEAPAMIDRRRLAVTGGRLALLALAALTGCGAVESASGAGPSSGAVLVGAPVPTATSAPLALLPEHLTGVGPAASPSAPPFTAPPTRRAGTEHRRGGRHRPPSRRATRPAHPTRSALTRAF